MKGFVALLSVIIVSVVLLGLALSGSTIAFFTRFNQLDRESYAQAQSLARSCVDQALLQLSQNYTYTASNQTIYLGTDICVIDSLYTVDASSTQKEVEVKAHANYHNSYANVTVHMWVTNPLIY